MLVTASGYSNRRKPKWLGFVALFTSPPPCHLDLPNVSRIIGVVVVQRHVEADQAAPRRLEGGQTGEGNRDFEDVPASGRLASYSQRLSLDFARRERHIMKLRQFISSRNAEIALLRRGLTYRAVSR